jgi:O-antigen/teichoic acid export membrane protein
LSILLARWLGLEAFGQYSLLWMGVLFVLSLHQAYVTQPFLSLVAGKLGEEKSAYFKSLTALQLLLSASIFSLAIIAFLGFKMVGYMADWLPWLPLSGLVASAYLLQDFLRKFCFAKGLYHLPLLLDSTVFGVMLAALATLYWTAKLELSSALWAILSAYFFSSVLGFWATGHRLRFHLNFQHLLQTAKEHYHNSFWLLGTSLVQWFSGNYFLVAAAAVLGPVAVGALRMAQNMVGLCHVLFLAMENIVPVEAARQFFSNGEKAMFRYLRRVGFLVGVPVVGLLLSLTTASYWLIGWLYGAEYQPFAYLVAAYSAVYVLGYLATLLRFALRSMQYTMPIFVGYSVSAVASVLLAYPLVRQWGVSGTMGGLFGAQVFTLLVYGLFIWRKTAASQTLKPSDPQTLAQ